ncbi:MAG: hypothetical protein CMO01_27090 [Thalassobius sp.]|nr:hypothetical protein [Thalassovita sp.]|tara:strand:- start:234 stop:500 length:267 start_codon:yes stop_codon:yes gene_type:complete
MGKIEVNTSIGERLARLIIALPVGVLLVAVDLPYLFFISFYLVVTGITGISLEYNILSSFKHEKVKSTASDLKAKVNSPVNKTKIASH